jgi:hypothetical protein
LDTIDSDESKIKIQMDNLGITGSNGTFSFWWRYGSFYQIINNEKDQNMIEYIRRRTGRNISEIYNKSIVSYKNISFDKVKSKLFYFYFSILKGLVPQNLRNEIFNSTTIGEKHRWMYDRYSLEKGLLETGFKATNFLNAKTNKIPEFGKYHLNLNSYRHSFK